MGIKEILGNYALKLEFLTVDGKEAKSEEKMLAVGGENKQKGMLMKCPKM